MRMWAWWVLAAVAVGGAGCQSSHQPETADRWYRGNLHTHTMWSDGDGFPEDVARWYRDHGYNFLAISDHNVMLQGEKWVDLATLRKRNAESSLNRAMNPLSFAWRPEVQGRRSDGTLKVRLRTYDEVRARLEKPQRFLMIPSEEISAAYGKKSLHLNATNLVETIKPAGGKSVVEVLSNNLRAIEAQARKYGREILHHINHPNFTYAITAEELAAVTEEDLFEVYNGHPGVHHLGDRSHISVEHMWDVANTIRLVKLKSRLLMGMACDDAHNYHVEGMNQASPGRGWVMVKAKSLTAESIIRAIEAGDFYASSGVTLRKIAFDPSSKTMELKIAPDGGAEFTTQFVGTLRDPVLPNGEMDMKKVGVVLATVKGRTARYTLTGNELYVRAVVTSSKPADVPVFGGQKKQAWVQPVLGS